jgi:hypothetical protein
MTDNMSIQSGPTLDAAGHQNVSRLCLTGFLPSPERRVQLTDQFSDPPTAGGATG